MYLEELFGLKGKVAVVTGGNQGIGRSLAIGLAKAGAQLVILSRSDASKVIKEIQEAGGDAYHIATDVTIPDQVISAVKEIESRSKTIDVLVNNAGIAFHMDALECDTAAFRKLIETDLIGVYTTARAAAEVMIRNKTRGSIINVASVAGHIVTIPQYQCAYNTAKAGVIHMTRSLAVEWAEFGIRVNSLSPGYVATDMCIHVPMDWQEKWAAMTPLGRMANPDEMVPAVLYMASGAASYTTGSESVVDGGYTCW